VGYCGIVAGWNSDLYYSAFEGRRRRGGREGGKRGKGGGREGRGGDGGNGKMMPTRSLLKESITS